MLTQRDRDHLRLLSIGFRIMSGITLVAGVATALFFVWINRLIERQAAAEPEVGEMTGFLVFLTIFVVVQSIVWTVAELLTGRFIQQRKHYIFCLVICAINLMTFPHGTALGIAGFVVLSRPSVRAQFAEVPPIVSRREPSP